MISIVVLKEKGAQKASDEGIQIDIETSRGVSVRKIYYFSTDPMGKGGHHSRQTRLAV